MYSNKITKSENGLSTVLCSIFNNLAVGFHFRLLLKISNLDYSLVSCQQRDGRYWNLWRPCMRHDDIHPITTDTCLCVSILSSFTCINIYIVIIYTFLLHIFLQFKHHKEIWFLFLMNLIYPLRRHLQTFVPSLLSFHKNISKYLWRLMQCLPHQECLAKYQETWCACIKSPYWGLHKAGYLLELRKKTKKYQHILHIACHRGVKVQEKAFQALFRHWRIHKY